MHDHRESTCKLICYYTGVLTGTKKSILLFLYNDTVFQTFITGLAGNHMYLKVPGEKAVFAVFLCASVQDNRIKVLQN